MKYLIINADDFGMSEVYNEVILDLIERNLISSTSIMVDEIDEKQKNQIDKLIELKKNRNLSIGLHLSFDNENFEFEILRQYDKFKSLFSFIPSHLDIHSPEYLDKAYPLIIDFCKINNLPCRKMYDFQDTFSTSEKIILSMEKSFQEIKDIVGAFEDGKSYEILFHPGKFDPNSKSSYNKERENDVKIIEKLNSIMDENDLKLISYLDKEYLVKY